MHYFRIEIVFYIIHFKITNINFDNLQKTTLNITLNILLRILNLNFIKIL